MNNSTQKSTQRPGSVEAANHSFATQAHLHESSDPITRRSHKGAKTSPRGTRKTPRVARRGPQGAQQASRGAPEARKEPRQAREEPHGHQKEPKSGQERHKRSPRGVKGSPGGARQSPRAAKRGPKRAQKASFQDETKRQYRLTVFRLLWYSSERNHSFWRRKTKLCISPSESIIHVFL